MRRNRRWPAPPDATGARRSAAGFLELIQHQARLDAQVAGQIVRDGGALQLVAESSAPPAAET